MTSNNTAASTGPKPAGAFLNRTKPPANPGDPTQSPVPLTETEQVQLQCDNAILEVLINSFNKIYWRFSM